MAHQRRQGRGAAWVDVYPFSGETYQFPLIKNSGARVELSEELAENCRRLWEPKAAKGLKSSWICFAKDIEFCPDGRRILMNAGAMPFYVVDGINKAIEGGASFAPQQGYVNCLSVGILTATADDKVIFQRRAPDVHCPNILIHEPCGYMASMNFVPRAQCDEPKFADDIRLFGLTREIDHRRKELADTFGVEIEQVRCDYKQRFLAAGWLTTEMYFSTEGRLEVPSTKLKMPEGQEVFLVPFEDLKTLVLNQGRLSRVNPEGYRPSNPTKIPLIDESLTAIIWGYEHLTGEKLDVEDTVARLNHDGLDIRVMDTSPGKKYEFPTRF